MLRLCQRAALHVEAPTPRGLGTLNIFIYPHRQRKVICLEMVRHMTRDTLFLGKF